MLARPLCSSVHLFVRSGGGCAGGPSTGAVPALKKKPTAEQLWSAERGGAAGYVSLGEPSPANHNHTGPLAFALLLWIWTNSHVINISFAPPQ